MTHRQIMQQQLALGITLPEHISFDTFISGANAQPVADLKQCAAGTGERFIYLWGTVGCGKTHLLQSACRHAASLGRRPLYLPLQEIMPLGASILQDLESLDLVCIDDLDAIAGDAVWEEALFHLYNRLNDHRVQLIAAAAQSPAEIPIRLADLRSRLSWGLCHQLLLPGDEDKRQLLIEEARRRGLELNGETADYILKHTARDPGSLKQLLIELDLASLAAQRRLTIPFVRAVLLKPD